MEEGCRHRHRAGALGHQLLIFHQGQDGRGDFVLADGDHLVHILFAHLIGQLAGGLDLDAVRKGGSGVQGPVTMLLHGHIHAGRTRRLDAVDLDIRPQGLDGKGNAGNQAAAAHRHNHGVQIGQLIQDFQTDGALACNHQFIVVGMDEGHPGFGLELDGLVVGVVVGARHQTDFGAQILGIFHLHDGGAVRHADNAFDPPAGGSQGHTLGVVARRTGDDAPAPLFFRELADLVVGAPHLETAGHLEVFGLEVEAAVPGQQRRLDQVGAACDLFQDKGGVIDFIQCKHNPSPNKIQGRAALHLLMCNKF